MVNPAVKSPQGLPSWLKIAAEAANNDIERTARQLAEKRWVGQAAQETAKSGIAATGVEAGMVAVAVPAFLGTMGLAAYTYLADQKYYDNKHYTPCGQEPRHLSPLKWQDSKLAAKFFAQHRPRPLFVDKPIPGKSVDQFLSDMIELGELTQKMADLNIRIFQLEQLGMTAEARVLRDDVAALENQLHTHAKTYSMVEGALQMVASAGGDAGAGDAPTSSDATPEAVRAQKEALVHALMLEDPVARTQKLAEYAGTFAELGDWESCQRVVGEALDSAKKVVDPEVAVQLKTELIHQLIVYMPDDPRQMPEATFRRFLKQVVESEMVSSQQDPQYLGQLSNLDGILKGWLRVVRVATPQSLPALAADGSQAVVPQKGEQGGALAVKIKHVPKPPVMLTRSHELTIKDKTKSLEQWIRHASKMNWAQKIGAISVAPALALLVLVLPIGVWTVPVTMVSFGIGLTSLMVWSDLNRIHPLDSEDVPLEKFPWVVVKWLSVVSNPDYGKLITKSKKRVDGREYNLIMLMDVGSYFKAAAKKDNYGSIINLANIEHQGRVWSASEKGKIGQLQIRWSDDIANNKHFLFVVKWLAARGNESVVHWVYREFLRGTPNTETALEALAAAENPLALRLIAEAHDDGRLTRSQ